MLCNLRRNASILRPPTATKVPLYLSGNLFIPTMHSLRLLAADFPIVLVKGNLDLVDPTIWCRLTIESDHGVFRFVRTREINKTVALTCSGESHVTMSWQNSLAHCFDIVTVKKLSHLFVHERLVGNVAETSYVQSLAFFDGLSPVLAGIGPGKAVKDKRRSLGRGEVERSQLTTLQASFEASGTLCLFFGVEVDLDGPSADEMPLESFYHRVRIFVVVEVDEAV